MAAGVASPYLRRKILDDINGVSSFSKPSTLLLALTTSVLPVDSDTMPSGVEVTWSGYAPLSVAMSASTWTATDATGTSSNRVALFFSTITIDASSAAKGWVLRDASGNVWESGALDAPIQPLAGQLPTVPVGTLLRQIA